MLRSITGPVVVLAALAACSHWRGGAPPWGGGRHTALSYAHYHSLEPGMKAKEILDKFGAPQQVVERNGTIRALAYRCEKATGKVGTLTLTFDKRGVLTGTALNGVSKATSLSDVSKEATALKR